MLAASHACGDAVRDDCASPGVYDRAFTNPAAFDTLLAAIGRELTAAVGRDVRVQRITLSGFSAGHGAVRAILREPRHFARVDAILLMDGMHTSYVPEGIVVEKGGTLDPKNLDAFVRFAEEAVKGSNSAPDHVDHFQGMPEFLKRLIGS